LSEGTVTQRPLPEALIRRFVGGRGFIVRWLYDMVQPGTDPLAPEMPLIFAVGPLTGTITTSNSGGHWGPALKYAGYDLLILEGRAPRPSYLFLHNDRAEVRDAAAYWGKTTSEAEEGIRQEVGVPDARIAGIGPAGENLVRFAAIQGDYGHVASKNGVGAVMGKKRLKAVAIVRGSRGLRAADPRAVIQVADDIAYDLRTDPSAKSLYEWGTLPAVVNLGKMGVLPIKNYTTNVPYDDLGNWEAPKLREAFDHRGHQCNACGMRHCHMQVIREGEHRGRIVDEPEYEGWSGCGWQIGATDKAGISWLNTQVDRACVDVNEFGWICGWVMECQERKLITERQLGFRLPWGDIKGADRLLQMISRRQGLGDLLAEGIKRAAEKLGGAAQEAAIYTLQGCSPRGHDHRGRWDEMLDTCTSSTGTLESGVPVHVTELGLPARINPFAGEEVARLVAGIRGRRHFEDSLGICIFTARTRMENLCRALNAVTGWAYSVDDAMRFGRRTAAILRAVRLRCGLGTDLEKPSARYGSTPHDGPAKGQAISEQWDRMVSLWYELVGYDRRTGKPLPKTLRDLGLDWLAKDLWGRRP
ncbi:MAG: hypothetical protein K6T92_03090, partial [Candidatus Rokubacteria bacterium]|nr:hypothetical protein [Candidatus Rokubacteria bacterium]